MYAFIKGIVDKITAESVVLECQGIGYRVFIPGSVIHYLPPVGMEVKLYTYLNVREDAMLLYGFLSEEDKEIFCMILGVSGIGPKGALSILSALTPDELRFAILSGDDKAISKAQGIGKKMAQKLIIELKDKLSLEDVIGGENMSGLSVMGEIQSDGRNDAISALVALGYSATESMQAVSKVNITEEMDTETIIKLALKNLAF